MIRLTTTALLVVLAGSALWLHAAANGFARGQAFAQRALQLRGVVVMLPNGMCELYDKKSAAIELEPPIRSKPVLAVWSGS